MNCSEAIFLMTYQENIVLRKTKNKFDICRQLVVGLSNDRVG